MEYITELLAKYPQAKLVLEIIGSLLIVAQVVVLVTPSKKDDAALEKIQGNSLFGKAWAFFVSFAPFQKGAKGMEMSSTNTEKK